MRLMRHSHSLGISTAVFRPCEASLRVCSSARRLTHSPQFCHAYHVLSPAPRTGSRRRWSSSRTTTTRTAISSRSIRILFSGPRRTLTIEELMEWVGRGEKTGAVNTCFVWQLKYTGPPALAAAWHVWAAATAGWVERQRLVRHGIVEVMGVGAAPARLPLAAPAADAVRRSQVKRRLI